MLKYGLFLKHLLFIIQNTYIGTLLFHEGPITEFYLKLTILANIYICCFMSLFDTHLQDNIVNV